MSSASAEPSLHAEDAKVNVSQQRREVERKRRELEEEEKKLKWRDAEALQLCDLYRYAPPKLQETVKELFTKLCRLGGMLVNAQNVWKEWDDEQCEAAFGVKKGGELAISQFSASEEEREQIANLVLDLVIGTQEIAGEGAEELKKVKAQLAEAEGKRRKKPKQVDRNAEIVSA